MDQITEPSDARRLWNAYEAVHAVCYFDPAFSEALARAGLTGGWNGYFAGRAAPLGAVSAPAVTALFFGFAPTMVERAFPKVWQRIEPTAVLAARFEAADTVLGPLLTELLDPSAVNRLIDELDRAVAACAPDGRALGAAWGAVAPPETPAARVWLATSVLREHRGDGHVAAATARGLTGLQTMLTHIGTGQADRGVLAQFRGWTETQWAESHEDLVAHGLLEASGRLTAAGVSLRAELESDTDRLSAAPLAALTDADWTMQVLNELGRAVVDRGLVPVPNPIGLPRP